MSVVAVKKEKSGITIGADSIRISGWWTQEKDKLAKLFVINKELVIGAAGLCATTAVFREFMNNHLPKSNSDYGWTTLMQEFAEHLNMMKSAPKFEDAEFLVVYKNKVFLLSGYFIREITDYYAIGAGRDYALSALFMKASVKEAIQTACHLSIFCEEPVNVIKIKNI